MKADELLSGVEDAISSSGQMPLGFFLVYEALDDSGERVLHYLAPDDLAYWQAVGYLYTALENLGAVLGAADAEDE